jgi:hypothetical protein
LGNKIVEKHRVLGLCAGQLDQAESIAGEATGGFDDERNEAHEIVDIVAQDRMVAVLLVRGGAHCDDCRRSRRSGEENTGCVGDRLGAVGDGGRVGDRDVDVLAPGEVDDACVSTGIASGPLDDAAVAVVLDVPPCARELKVLVPSLGVCSKVSFAAAVGGGEDKRLSREDTVEDAVAGGDDRLKELDECVLDSVVAVDKEELGGEAVQAVEWHFRCLDQVAAGT